MQVPFSPPDISQAEIDAVTQALRSGWITTGPKTKELEREIARYCGTEQAVCLNSATACMEMTLHLLGIGPGDEVITSAYTYTATASVICHVGATPVLVDTAKDSYEMDYDQMEQAITPRTKAIIPVDIGGVLCDYPRIYQAVEYKKHLFQPKNDIQQQFGRVIVMADSAHGLGAEREGMRAGQLADFTCFSFHAVKNLTTAEGGAVTWRGHRDAEWYKGYQLLSLHGQTKDAFAKYSWDTWEYDVMDTAYKCNMTDIAAAMGLAQLGRYSGLLAKRRKLIEFYNSRFSGSQLQLLPHYQNGNVSNGHLYMVRLIGKDLEFRNRLIERMAEQGVATNVHYKPLPMHTAYRNLGFSIADFPNAYHMFENEITLPLFSKMTGDQAFYVTELFQQLLGRK